MKIIKSSSWMWIVFVFFIFSGNARTENQLTCTEDALIFLANAPVVSVHPDEDAGRTEPWMVILDDGNIRHKAIFKHIDRPRPHPLPDSYRYELSAYRLHRLLGLDFIPPTTVRTLENRTGSLQLYMEDCVPLEEAGKDESVKISMKEIEERIQDIVVFDALTYCGCRHSKDILYQLSSGNIYRVDYSEAFEPRRSLPSECSIKGCSQALWEKLESISDYEIRRVMEACLNEQEIDALLMRRRLIQEKIRTSKRKD